MLPRLGIWLPDETPTTFTLPTLVVGNDRSYDIVIHPQIVEDDSQIFKLNYAGTSLALLPDKVYKIGRFFGG